MRVFRDPWELLKLEQEHELLRVIDGLIGFYNFWFARKLKRRKPAKFTPHREGLMPSDRTFTVLQLTDLHLTDEDTQSRTEPKILGALKGMNARFRALMASKEAADADLILVTGDITDSGEIASWTHFWDGVLAAGMESKVRVVLGNHDVASLKLFAPLVPRKDRSLRRARYSRGLRLGRAAIAYPWHERFFDDQLLVVALRSTQEDNVTNLTNAIGRLPRNQLRKLKTKLKDNMDARHKIVALHHPPKFPEDGSVNPFLHDIRKEDANEFLDICEEYGVDLIMHGHMHRYMEQRSGSLLVIGAAASTEPVRTSTSHVELCRYQISGSGIAHERIQVAAASSFRKD